VSQYTEQFRIAVAEIARLNGWTIPEAWEKCMRAKEIVVLPTDADAVAFVLASAQGRQTLEAMQPKFGFHVGQDVEIIAPGAFNGQQTHIVEFTDTDVVMTVSGPPGEPDSEWPFNPQELKAI
jgi:hypothetical protein